MFKFISDEHNFTISEIEFVLNKYFNNLLKMTPEADCCYYKNECGKNCTPKREQRNKYKKYLKDSNMSIKEFPYYEEPCMWEECEKCKLDIIKELRSGL